MGKLDYEMLRKRQERIQKRKEENADSVDYGIGFIYQIDGKFYPVCAYFQIGKEEEAKAKLRYLVKGKKE